MGKTIIHCFRANSNLRFIRNVGLILTVICVCGTNTVLYAQTPVDSLNRLIKNAKTDTEKINLLNKKTGVLTEINLDSANANGNKTISYAVKEKYLRGEGQARIQMADIFCYKGNYLAAKSSLVSAQSIFIKLNNFAGLAKTYSGYGMLYGMQGKYDTSIIFYKKSVIYNDKIHNERLVNSAYSNIAVNYQMQSNYAEALVYSQKALKYAENIHDENSQSYIWENMGGIYDSMEDYVRAEQSYNKAIILAKKGHIKNVELYAYSNLSGVYTDEKKFLLAYEYAMKSATLGRATGDLGMTVAGLSKAVGALADQGKLSEALKLGKQSLALADSSKQPFNTYQLYAAVGDVLTRQRAYSTAIPYLEKAFTAIKGTDIVDGTSSTNYANLSECYEKTGKYLQALTAYKKSAKIIDSVRSIKNIRKATEKNMNYEYDKKQQAELALRQKQEAANKIKQVILVAILSVFFVISFIAILAYRGKQAANKILEDQKHTIEDALATLKITQKQLIQSEKMASLGELAAGVAHEIQNPLNFVNNFSDVNIELLDELTEEAINGNRENVVEIAGSIKQNLEKIRHHGGRAGSIVKGMLQHSRPGGSITVPTNINALADEYLHLSYQALFVNDKSFKAGLITHFDDKMAIISAVPQDIGRVLLNLFNNAFYAVQQKQKSTGPDYNPVVEVSTKVTDDFVQIVVKDNGIGIPENIKEKIMQPFFTTKPTGEGTGLGLSISYDIIVKGYGGTIDVKSSPGVGSEFIIKMSNKREGTDK